MSLLTPADRTAIPPADRAAVALPRQRAVVPAPDTLAARRRGLSPLTLRILAINLLALAILVVGVLYLGRYQDQLYQAFARLHGIIRMQVAYQRAPRFSDRRLAAGMKRLNDQTQVEYIFVPPEQVMAEVAEPTEAEVAAQFAKYGDVLAGTGDVGFGYRLPDRVKIEWMTIDRATIAAAVFDILAFRHVIETHQFLLVAPRQSR